MCSKPIPQEIRVGEKIQRERDRIIAQAEEESERIVQLAHEERDKAVEDHELIRSAEQRANTIIERAQRDAAVLKSEADEYARGVLVALDEQLGGMDEQIAMLLTTVRNGLETLTGDREAASDDPA